jgi:hypothetical protein
VPLKVGLLLVLSLVASRARADCLEKAGAFTIVRDRSAAAIVSDAKIEGALLKLGDDLKLPATLLPSLVPCDPAPTTARPRLIVALSAAGSTVTCRIFPNRGGQERTIPSSGTLCSEKSIDEYLNRLELQLAAALAVSIMDEAAQAAPGDDRGPLREAASAAHRLFAFASKGLTRPSQPEARFWEDARFRFNRSASAVDQIINAAALSLLRAPP